MALPIRNPGQAELQLTANVDFTGGLNLTDEWLKVAPNETPDCLNVVFDSKGGFRQRNGVVSVNATAASADIGNMFRHLDTQILAHAGTNLLFSTGGNFSTAGAVGALTGPVRGASYGNRTWITRNAENTSMRWDGSTLTALTDPASPSAWDPDYLTPSGTKMPRARFVAVQHDRLFVASTSENGTAHPNRVRFSFVGDPGSWLQNDFIDINVGKDGDVITGIVAAADHVVVFKRDSVHMILGFDRDSFQVITLIDGTGAVSQDLIAVGAGAVWFFDRSRGLFSYHPSAARASTEGAFRWHFEKLQRLLDDEELVVSSGSLGVYHTQVRLQMNGQAGLGNYGWVYDTSLGAWSRFSVCVGRVVELAENHFGVCVNGAPRYLLRINGNATQDSIAGVQTTISAYWRSAWETAGTPTEFKRWGRSRFVASVAEATALTMRIELFKDYEDAPLRIIDRVLDGTTDGMLWDTDDWDEADWSREVSSRVHVFRGPSVGRARSVAYKISNLSGADWAVQSVGYRFRRMSVRR